MSSTSTTDFPSELRALWRTRPVRTPDDSKIAGVCGGFGRRYGVDPVLFRIAFVIAALWGGAGVFLYALLWLLLRSAGNEVSKGESLIGRGRASGSKAAAVVLVVVVLLSAPTFGGSGETFFVGAGFLMAAAMLVGWYGLHRRTPTPPAGWAEVSAVRPPTARTSTPWTPWTAQTATTQDPTTQDHGAAQVPGSGPDAPFGPPVPPSWDPLGAAPFAWDLPDPDAVSAPGAASAPEPARRRSRLTKITLGLALIAVAVTTGLSALVGITWLDSTRIAAVALAVVAGGLLIGAITRRGHGLLVVAGPLAGFVLLASLVQVPEGGWENNGDLRVEITGPAQLGTPVTHEFGDVTVDMRGLELDRDRSYSITNEVGEVTVLLPAGLNVEATCHTDLGKVECPESTGGDAGGPVLTLDITNDLGDVEVTR
ncbi:PspC domain-containing protein [Rhodococcus sp. IEGM 1408]|uniref:PspC domain-containing protein n=1 Tax=Rhodococcus sp. IEGM 1408 TaxID=3082220 RepID=UPI002955A51C|nr:PspC domain-containing protein [Rhodococcus sp. IEGM 1408]MDV8000975.1 PspC domain-containing protein [Rhodococcus sp. IEGM 1408]